MKTIRYINNYDFNNNKMVAEPVISLNDIYIPYYGYKITPQLFIYKRDNVFVLSDETTGCYVIEKARKKDIFEWLDNTENILRILSTLNTGKNMPKIIKDFTEAKNSLKEA